MIVKHFEIQKKLNNSNIFLFYGNNEGHQNEVINEKFIKSFNGSIIKYEEHEFISNIEIVTSEILSMSLFEIDKIIIISRVTDKITNFINEISKRKLKDIKIILKCGVLEKKSKLRNLFEKNKEFIVVPFYKDDNKILTSIVIKFLNNQKIKMSRESINLLISRANGNRNHLNNELEKIFNYSITNKNINYEVVSKLSNQSENFEINELVDNFLEKNRKNITKILNENNYSNEDCILILRTILSKSKRLINILEKLNEIRNIDQVIYSIKPPIFWKDKDRVKKQANTWNIDDLKNKIIEINELETLVKSNSKNSVNFISDFIINF